jgi:hypothetical protein
MGNTTNAYVNLLSENINIIRKNAQVLPDSKREVVVVHVDGVRCL